MSLERIDKVLSHEGFGTRKEVRRILRANGVLINGKVVTDPGTHFDIDKDELVVEGEKLNLVKNVYLMMNKCQNVVCANKDGLHETVFSLLDEQYKTPYYTEKLHLVGRLDIDTEGLLIFTTDGKLTHKLISPKNNCPKKYFVTLEKAVDKDLQNEYKEKLSKGIHIEAEDNEDEADCLPALIEFTEEEKNVYLTITEGKYHQVKRMFKALDNKVDFLKRVMINNLILDESLKPGQYRSLTESEINILEN